MIPPELYEEIKNEDCIIFAGAGISTESGVYGKPSFYEIIKHKSKYKGKKSLSFPELMQYYCDKVDGGRKNKLIRDIIDRIEFFSGYGEIYNSTTMFHSYIAQIPYFKIIATTNWDNFFERGLNIVVPTVEDKDIPFWYGNKRKILKIHGCVTRPSTIIATSKDYAHLIEIEARKPIFTKLKDLIATKTFLFVGYSMRDKNIQLIYDTLLKKLGNFARMSYAIDPDPNKESIDNWEKRGVKILKTGGITFMRDLIKKLARDSLIKSEDLVEFYESQYPRIVAIHHQTDDEANILSKMYQDGVIHALQNIIGNYRHGIRTVKDFKDELNELSQDLNKYISDENFIEIAYYSGRTEILRRFLNDEKKDIPAYFNGTTMQPDNRAEFTV